MNLRHSPSPVHRIEAVVIGASAGGVEALLALLPALPARTPVAVMIVLHIPRNRPSLLVDIFTARCAMPVKEALDGEPIMPGTIYFAPPDYHLLVDEGPRLSLSVDELVKYSRPSIDVLFESAADLYAENLLGIVLTGGNDDGAAGLLAVRRAGGVTVVQDPQGAQVSAMPAAAMKHAEPDHVLPLDRIAGMLQTLTDFAVTVSGGAHGQPRR